MSDERDHAESPAPAAGSVAWRREQRDRLLAVAAGARLQHGFGWLDDAGGVDPSKGLELWINARMTYVFSRAVHEGPSGGADPPADLYADLAAHGVTALRTVFHDERFGGWFHEVDRSGHVTDDTKACYDHAFVILAAATATRADIRGADDLLTDALAIHRQRFWDDCATWVLDTRSRDWEAIEAYRGGNAAMHTVEAWLAAARVTDPVTWLDLAGRLAHAVVTAAQRNDWRLIEHFHPDLTPDLDYNQDRPRDPFRPFGATPGHAFEWARLLVELERARADAGLVHVDFQAAAKALFRRACDDVLTERPGLPYTTDWHGEPVVAERFHWVIAEAAMSAEALHGATGDRSYADLAGRWWSEIDEWFIDGDGSWRHELGPAMEPSARTWRGRPDAYHAYNALTHRSVTGNSA